MLKAVISLTLVVVECAVGQDIQKGLCGADVVGIPDFDIKDYAGMWYQIERINNEYEGACSSTEFRTADDGGLILKSTQLVDGELETIEGEVNTDSADGSGKLELTFNFPTGDSFITVSSTHYIVALESSSFALVMGCDNIDESSRSVFAWKLSRTRSGLTPEANAAIDAVVAASPYLSSVVWEKTFQTKYCGDSSSANSPDTEYCSRK